MTNSTNSTSASYFYLKTFFSRTDIKIIIFCSLGGGVLQYLAEKYLEKHPDLIKKKGADKNDLKSLKSANNLNRHLTPEDINRAGSIKVVTTISIEIFKFTINYVAENGLLTGLLTGGSLVVVRKIPTKAISKISNYLRDAFPQNLPHLERAKFILIDGQKIYLDNCSSELQFLFEMLENDKLPFEDKKQTALSTLSKYLNIKTVTGRRNFVLCITCIFYILYNRDKAAFFAMIKGLIRSIRNGSISKPIGRVIVRKLKRQGVPIDAELLRILEEE